MATFANGESGLSVRTKINNVLQHADGTAGGLVINDAGGDVDFRVESDTNANAIFMDGATGNVGIGTGTPVWSLDVLSSGTSGARVRTAEYGQFTLTDGTRSVYLQNYAGIGALGTSTNNALMFAVNGTERARIDTSGRLLIGTTSASGANLLQVNSDASINGIRVGRGNNAISTNTAIGITALNANTTGTNNTAIGVNALIANTTGADNTATGINALASSNAQNNSAYGVGALQSNTSGNNNVAMGQSALMTNTTGANNTVIGQGAGSALTTGDSNTIIGRIAGTAGLANTVIIGAGASERLRISDAGNMGIGTISPNAASIIDAQSTTKGVRFPNMTTTEKNAIANVAGNVIFDTTLGKLCVNTGSGWQTITSA